MKKLYLAEYKKLTGSIKLYISLFIGVILFLHPLFANYTNWAVFTPVELLSFPLATSDFTPFAAVFCVLPYADSFCEEYNSGYYRFIFHRVGANRYAAIKCFVVAISGALVMTVCMSSAIIMSLVCAGRVDTVDSVSFMQQTVWGKNGVVLYCNGIFYYSMRIFVAAMFGAVWALVGLLTASMITNKYTTLVIPFVIYQFLWYSLGETAINPVYLLRADDIRIPSISFVIIYQTVWIAILSFLSYNCIKKRVVT